MEYGKINNHYDALIRAGFSGLYQLPRLRDDLGLKRLSWKRLTLGNMDWNRYPGARCDSESHGYAYFFSRDLHQNWQWSERYPGHTEIRAYLNYVADTLDLKKDILFNTTVSSCRFITEKHLWEIKIDDGSCLFAKWLITAVGCLSTANVPDIPGLSSFKGQWYPQESRTQGVDFAGLRRATNGLPEYKLPPKSPNPAKILRYFKGHQIIRSLRATQLGMKHMRRGCAIITMN